MKKNYKSKYKKIYTITLGVTLILLIVYSIYAFPNDAKQINSENNYSQVLQTECSINLKDEDVEEVYMIVDMYIENMMKQNAENIENMISSKDIGFDAKIRNYDVVNEYVNKPDQKEQLASGSTSEIILSQYDYILEQFGVDAWENISYEIVKTDCPSKKEGFVNTETGQIINYEEYTTIAENYWRNISKSMEIKYEDFIDIQEFSGKFDKENIMNILIAMEKGYSPPVRVELIDEYDYYIVYFSFNGKKETDNGEKAFRISIDNKDGLLKINFGIRWNIPLSDENMSDI